MTEALSLSPENPEVHQTIASVRMSQCRPNEAKSHLLQSFNLISSLLDKCLVNPSDGDTRMDESEDFIASAGDTRPEISLEDQLSSLPSLSTRMNLARLLTELSLLDEALKVLQVNQLEDDEDPEIWYLFGWIYYLMGGFVPEMLTLEMAIEQYGSHASNLVFDKDQLQQWQSDCLSDSKECLEMVLRLHEKYGIVDKSMLTHTQELLDSFKN